MSGPAAFPRRQHTRAAHTARRGKVEPFHVMELLKAANDRAATHGDVITLCAGQPSTPAPRPALDAAQRAIQDQDLLGYTDAVGTSALRAAIAAHYDTMYGLDVDPDQVVVTTGSSAGFTALFLAVFDAGDRVAMARPGYPAYRNALQALGCDVVELDCDETTRYQPTTAMLDEVSARTGGPPAGLILASPANPTGTIISPEELAALSCWCETHGTLLISDEIYHGVSYGRRAATAWETSREAVLVGSFSKYFSMTGWRIGWLVLPRGLVRTVELLLGNLNICPPAISQVAALAALSPQATTELDGHVQRYARNRELLLARLPEIGVATMAPPDGAFYLYAEVSHLTPDTTAWTRQVLADVGVALTPGVDFDTVHGDRFVRLSFAGSTDEVNEAMDRLVRYVGRR
ncbi:Aspartate aminotransferase [Austwickia sp. TVS 96-490-7B]|uniref:pyridoxal phosphate-dependent aminotransferase n=1 Tax=Austwickia sp. TVS 96-490-7B TaxID=2830843 RepID=UPI001D699F8F|nr:pyridoxal phosphate-dependent aminotransferase [Austwickia sp. TVS 96-490-7B]MBW3085316.1 Aspartate aminotransferase [Austwickia sp. TVS 96-490-7B]